MTVVLSFLINKYNNISPNSIDENVIDRVLKQSDFKSVVSKHQQLLMSIRQNKKFMIFLQNLFLTSEFKKKRSQMKFVGGKKSSKKRKRTKKRKHNSKKLKLVGGKRRKHNIENQFDLQITEVFIYIISQLAIIKRKSIRMDK